MSKCMLITAFLLIGVLLNAQDEKIYSGAPHPAKGSKVFIENDNENEERAYPHLVERLQNWGYWVVVTDKTSADFIIEQVLNPKGVLLKGYIIIKGKDGKEIARSITIKAGNANPWNGFSVWRGFSLGIGRWLKGEKK